jgi:hypothetical protein
MAVLALVTKIDKGQRQMPSNNGYINLWRDIEKQPWSDDAVAFGVFTKLMLRVQHKSYVTEYKGLKVALQPGERVLSYPDIVDMFKQVTDRYHAIRLIKKFKSLSQVYTRELKENNVHLGFVLGFFGWEKWQNCTTPQTTPATTPEALNLKALQVGKTTPQTTPQTTHINNNVLNKLKDNACFDNMPVPETFLKERSDAFDDFWKLWSDAKKLVGGKNTAPKAKTKTKFLNETFPASKVRKLGVEMFDREVETMLDLVWLAHDSIAKHKKTNTRSDWFNCESMWPAKFLSNAQWRDEA